MGDDPLGVLVRDLRDQREEPVPERERVAGMEAAVRELRDPVERQRVELEELPDACEMEEPVALHHRRSDPDHEPDDRAPEEGPRPRGNGLGPRPAALDPDPQRRQRNDHEDDERQRESRAEGECHRERAEHDDERPREGRREAPNTERAREQPARREHDGGREREPQIQEDHGQRPTSVAAFPEASQAAPSR